MLKPETRFYRTEVRPNLIHFGLLHRIENVVETGTPDITYCLRRTVEDGPGVSGWLETKFLREWPRRARTLVRFEHYTREQADWLADWSALGGKACLLAKIESEYLLLPGRHARIIYKGVDRCRMYELAAVHGRGVFPTGRIVRWLTDRS